MFKRSLIFIIFTVLIFVSVTYAKKDQYKGKNFNLLQDTTQKILLLRIDSVATEYYDDTKIDPDIEFSDTFFVDAANNLFHFELRKVYPVTLIDSGDSNYSLNDFNSYSAIKNGGSEKEVGEKIKVIAEKYDVSFVLVPHKVYMKHITTQPQAWREAPSYEQPVNYKAISKINIQVWSKDGELLLENSGFSDTGRPVLYKIVRKRKKDDGKDKDIAAFAKRFYSPPIVRALNKAIIKSLRF